MSTKEIDAHLSASVIAAYERLEIYSDVLYGGVHPSEIPNDVFPPVPVALVHFRTDGLRLRGSREHGLRAFENLLRSVGQTRPPPFDAAIYIWSRDNRDFHIAAAVHAAHKKRSDFLGTALRKLRQAPEIQGADCIHVGMAHPLQAAFATWWMDSDLTIQDRRDARYELPERSVRKRDLRPRVVRMMHELALRRIQLEGCVMALRRLSYRAREHDWQDWGEARVGTLGADLPQGIDRILEFRQVRWLTTGSAIDQVQKLADIREQVVKGRLELLLSEVRLSEKGYPTASSYEFYATGYLSRTAQILAKRSELPEEDGDVETFDQKELNRESTAETFAEPELPKPVDLGPQHYGYNILSYDSDK